MLATSLAETAEAALPQALRMYETTAATSASDSCQAKDGIAGPVGAPSVATAREPSSTTRIGLVACDCCTSGAALRRGKSPTMPFPAAVWQAAHRSLYIASPRCIAGSCAETGCDGSLPPGGRSFR